MASAFVAGRFDGEGTYYYATGIADGIRYGDTKCGELSHYALLCDTSKDIPPLAFEDDRIATQLALHFARTMALGDDSGERVVLHTFVGFDDDSDSGELR